MLNADEEEKFWVFYAKTSQALSRKAFRMCGGHQADAEDALQRAYLKALQNWCTVADLADQQRFAWMATTLSREVLQMWREPHRTRETESCDDESRQQVSPVGAAVDDALVARDRYRQACRAIARLGGRQSEILMLHCIAGYEMVEIAEMLDISPATVRVHLHDGRKGLRATIGGEEETADG
jgi:RNA polymerase sigma-70 factor (ECF subfamily)